MSTVVTVEMCAEQLIIYWLAPLWSTSFVPTVLQEVPFSYSPNKEKSLLNMHDNSSIHRWTPYGWTICPPLGGDNHYYTLLKLTEIQYVAAHQLSTKMVLWFLVFPFDSSHIAGNIQKLFPQEGGVFLKYHFICRPSDLFMHYLIIPQFQYLRVGILKNRFCTLFWNLHVISKPVCHAWRYTCLEIRGESPAWDVKGMNAHRQYSNRELLVGNSDCLF